MNTCMSIYNINTYTSTHVCQYTIYMNTCMSIYNIHQHMYVNMQDDSYPSYLCIFITLQLCFGLAPSSEAVTKMTLHLELLMIKHATACWLSICILLILLSLYMYYQHLSCSNNGACKTSMLEKQTFLYVHPIVQRT